jgi:D-xylose transport system permease protein
MSETKEERFQDRKPRLWRGLHDDRRARPDLSCIFTGRPALFFNTAQLSNLMLQTSVTGIIAVGMLMVIVAGQIDLSVGSVLGFAGAVAAIALTSWEFGLPSALLAAIVIGSLIGLAQGALTAYLNIPAFIVTLGGLLAWRGAVKAVTKSETIPIADPVFKSIGQSYITPQLGWILAGAGVLFVLAVAFRRAQTQKTYELGEANYAGEMLKALPPVAAILIFIYVMNSYAGIPIPVLIFSRRRAFRRFSSLTFTTFGRYLYAIGGNPDAARLSGINNKQNIVKVFVLWAR